MKLALAAKTTIMLLSCSILFGCASEPIQKPLAFIKQVDPFEDVNRATYDFNNKFDQNVFEPVARVYADNTPSFVQTGIGNFFGNMNDIWTGFNSFLQGNIQDGFTDFMRVGLNSTFGLFGLLDIASEAQIPKHRNDLGQTLGVWGVPDGPYIVIPFLGPSVTRDAFALPIDFYGDVWTYARPVSYRNMGEVIRLVDKRAGYLDSYSLMQAAALDEYIFVRDSYLQRIAGQIETRRNHKQLREDEEEMKQQMEEDNKKEGQQMAPGSPAPGEKKSDEAAPKEPR